MRTNSFLQFATDFLQAIVIALVIIAVAIMLVRTAIPRIERAECEKWAKQAEDYHSFEYTDWQKKQCNL